MQQETLLETLRIVANEPSQRTLAHRLGFSVGKTNYIVKALVEKGFVKVERFKQSENKLNYCYVLTPKGIQERIKLTEKFIAIKQQEYQQLSQELAAIKSADIEPLSFKMQGFYTPSPLKTFESDGIISSMFSSSLDIDT